MHFENALLTALALLPLALAGPRQYDVRSKIPSPSSTGTLEVTSILSAEAPKRTGPDPDGPIEIPEWDFYGTIKSGYWYEPEFVAEALERNY